MTAPVQGAERQRWLTAFNTVPSILPTDGNGSYVYMYLPDGTPVSSDLSRVPQPAPQGAPLVAIAGTTRKLPLLTVSG